MLLEQFQVRANLVVPIVQPNAEGRSLWGLLIAHRYCLTLAYPLFKQPLTSVRQIWPQ
jgi:hypothetical protein